ncbi:hypothetical protein KY309_03580 [Candidatus Woesearchaeota archaeon]|nr:hypothetical protein [Candidatus Woesearchaeota archaeon]
MAVKEVLKESVPDFVKQTPEWPVFLRWISQRNIKTKAQLKSVLNAEIKDNQKKLESFSKPRTAGTNSRVLRPAAKRLDFLKVCRDRILKYL